MVNIQQDIKRVRDETEDYALQQQQQRKRRYQNNKLSIITSSKIHDFTLKAYTHQHGIVDVQLSKILTDFRCAVLFCYAHDFTEQAAKDLRLIEDHTEKLIHTYQTAPLAMSTDHFQVHFAFACSPNGLKFKPTFPLISDHVRLITNHLGILDREQGCSKRAIFIMDSMRNLYHTIHLQENEPFPMTTVISMVASCVTNM